MTEWSYELVRHFERITKPESQEMLCAIMEIDPLPSIPHKGDVIAFDKTAYLIYGVLFDIFKKKVCLTLNSIEISKCRKTLEEKQHEAFMLQQEYLPDWTLEYRYYEDIYIIGKFKNG